MLMENPQHTFPPSRIIVYGRIRPLSKGVKLLVLEKKIYFILLYGCWALLEREIFIKDFYTCLLSGIILIEEDQPALFRFSPFSMVISEHWGWGPIKTAW